MKIHCGRLGGIAALTAVVSLASGPSFARQEVSISETNAESSLIGIRLETSTYRDVLKKYGQPDEIQAGGPFTPTPPAGAASASSASGGGKMGGGMSPGSGGGKMGGGAGGPSAPSMASPGGSGGSAGGGGGSKKTPSKNGFPNSEGGGGSGGGSGGGPGSGGPGSGGMTPGSGGGLPGFGPSSGGEGSESGAAAGGGSDSSDDNPPLKETTWWYHDHKIGQHIAFVFNRVGQVIQIGEYGTKKLTKMKGNIVPLAGATRRGITLGTSMGSVIGKYGWSLDGAHDAANVIMRFGRKDKVAFQVVNNVVLGITVGVTR